MKVEVDKKTINRLINTIKELEFSVKGLSEWKATQVDINNKQSEYNVHIANNMTALGQKVFPEKFEKVNPKDKPGGVEIKTGPEVKESNIITP